MREHQIEKKKKNYGKDTSAQYPEEFIYEVLSYLVQGLWRTGFGRSDRTDGWTDGLTGRTGGQTV